MEPVSIAIIATAIFGVVTALSIFIRQLLLSRDKDLNDRAQERALAQETRELEKLRIQMESSKRFKAHYQVLGDNKDAIKYLDERIEGILAHKWAIIKQYGRVAEKESAAIIGGDQLAERKAACDLLRNEIDQQLCFYNTELHQLQIRRASMWDTHSNLLVHLVEQEKSRNEMLDKVYQRHTGVLEKIYIRHNENAEHVAQKTIDASTSAFSFITAPLQMLLQYFGLSTGISPDQVREEAESRENVSDVEDDINSDSSGNSESEDYDESDSKDSLSKDKVEERVVDLTN